MPGENSVNEVFRFIQLRPKRPLRETPSVPLLDDTPLAVTLTSAPTAQRRMSAANAALERGGADTVRTPGDVPLGPEILAALDELRRSDDATTGDLVDRLANVPALLGEPGFDDRGVALSDTLLAAFFATNALPAELGALQDVHRVYHLLRQLRDGTADAAVPLAEFIRRPILAPAVARTEDSPRPRAAAGAGRSATRAAAAAAAASPASAPDDDVSALIAEAADELARLDRPEHLVQPDGMAADGAGGDGAPFTLTVAARQRLSRNTLSLLRERGIDLATTPIDAAVTSLLADKAGRGGRPLHWPGPVVTADPGVTLPPAPAPALVRPAGVADLLVVKQQIKRYEAGEIAHVENVLAGEKKSRAHRQLDRVEETTMTESETTRQQETELTTADRFELNRETSQTIKEDQQVGLGLSLSGKYGPTVEFSSNFEMNLATSSEETAKSSSRYARDVVKRSLERVTERVLERRSRTTIRETEETNLHELNNDTGAHVRGIYQFIDKVYEAQVFNYGVREMFDFMVPEPASFLWYVEQHPTLDLKLPPPPPKLELVAPDATYITEDNAPALAATYGATEVEAPPPLYQRLATGFKHGTDNASESDQPHSTEQKELSLPAGYRPLRARVRGLAFTDENPVIAVGIGGQRVVWRPASGDRVGLSDGKNLAHQPDMQMWLIDEPYESTAESKLEVSMLAWETNTFAVDVVIVLRRTDEEFRRWQLATYKKIRAAYDDRVRQYDQQVDALRAAAEAKAADDARRPYGAPPAENVRTVVAELKKHCISIVTQQRYDAFDATTDDAPPWFDFVEAAAEGAYVRFFEQAFEWDQMQYVFYPYFWARKSKWIDRFVKQDVDPAFLEFLRAGSARVVVPVRPGFEVAVTHFMETGKIWGGEGDPPEINSPLYVSIVDEIRERTGAPQGEMSVGDPWDVRVPTALVILRDGADLPRWERVAPGEWNWQPVPPPGP
jgi:hypothetical protein